MKIHLIGDSLVQSRRPGHSKFYSGWGDLMSAFLSSDVEIINYAIGGRSSRRFLNECRVYDNGQFTTQNAPLGVGFTFDKIEKDDYVFIQFMCNDDDTGDIRYRPSNRVALGGADENGIFPTVVPQKDMLIETKNWNDGWFEEDLFAGGYNQEEISQIVKEASNLVFTYGKTFYPYNARATYKGYLKFYIDHIRAKGANPILIISGAKCLFTDGKIKPIAGYYGGKNSCCDFTYVEAQKQLSNELSVPMVNLFEIEKIVYEEIGEERASLFHNISINDGDIKEIDIAVSQHCVEKHDWISEYDKRHEEKDFISIDRVHKNPFGAYYQAALIADDLLKKGILKDYLNEKPIFLPQIPKALKIEKEIFSVFEFINF